MHPKAVCPSKSISGQKAAERIDKYIEDRKDKWIEKRLSEKFDTIILEVKQLYDKLQKAEAELEDIRDAHTRVMSEQCPADEVHCACVPILRRELAELWEKVAWYFECIGVGSYVCRTTKAVFELANNTKHAEKELRDG